jgi:hypothetical protein
LADSTRGVSRHGFLVGLGVLVVGCLTAGAFEGEVVVVRGACKDADAVILNDWRVDR